MQNPTVKIIVATHKAYWMPESSLYLPLQVGSEGKATIGFQSDNMGQSISEKNPYYCELTGIYWAWKNIKAEYLGLVHYRRYFSVQPWCWSSSAKQQAVLSLKELEMLLQEYSVLLPKPRNYFVQNRKNQYIKAHGQESLLLLETVLAEKYSEYLGSYQKTMQRTWGHVFNMFIMHHALFDKYCAWMFDVLFAVEAKMKEEQKEIQPRIFGFISERLLDVWLEQNKIPYKELKCINLERVNWPKKIYSFLQRKFSS